MSALALMSFFSCSDALALDYYRGKTVNLIVGFAAGGGMDVPTRLFARYLGKHLPGATVIVRNMPGAGGMIALNNLYARADRDGTSILFDSWACECSRWC